MTSLSLSRSCVAIFITPVLSDSPGGGGGGGVSDIFIYT